MKLFVQSFGCQMSSADGEEFARPLLARGFSATAEPAEADAFILNTCTVRQHAEDRAVSLIGRLRDWKEERPERFLIVAGCAAERLGGWLKTRFPYVDLVVGAKSIEQYPAILEQALAERFDWARENAGAWEATPAPLPSPVSAYVTIMRGCNYACTYCIVPAVRGREVYRPGQTVLSEVRRRAEGGAREVMLLGQTVNSYRDPETGRDFADLLRAVDAVEAVERLRFMSPHPFFLDEGMMGAMAECPKVSPHLHLPAQSGSDEMLRRMRRNYTPGQYLARVERLRALIPDLALTTDFIVGFPGESAEDFAATLRLAEAGDFHAAYCFKFSAREGTPAATLPEQVPEPVKEERLARLLEQVEAATRGHLDAMVGRRVEVLLETPTDGRTRHYFKARLEQPGKPGSLVAAEVTGRTETALKCRAIPLQSAPPPCYRGRG